MLSRRRLSRRARTPAPAPTPGRTAPDAEAASRPEPIAPADAPVLPAAAPTVHEEPLPAEPVHEEPVHETAVHESLYRAPVHEEPRPRQPVHGEPCTKNPSTSTPAQLPVRMPHPRRRHPGRLRRPARRRFHAVDPADEPYGYDDADLLTTPRGRRPCAMAGGAAIRTSKGPSKKVRRRRRFLALLLTLSVFVIGRRRRRAVPEAPPRRGQAADYPGPGTGEVIITVQPGAGPRSVAAELQEKKVVANADTFLREFAGLRRRAGPRRIHACARK